jgi:hypothetical protein
VHINVPAAKVGSGLSVIQRIVWHQICVKYSSKTDSNVLGFTDYDFHINQIANV